MRFAPAIPLLLLFAPCFAQIMTSGGGNYGGMTSQTNNPVSMVFEHKQSQTLGDGTHINTVTHEFFYRDNLGRTRIDFEIPVQVPTGSPPIHTIHVQDPVARTFTTWRTGVPGEVLHQFNRTDQNPPPTSQAGSISPRNGEQIHLIAKTLPAPPVTDLRPKTTTEQLGTQDVQGVPCEASRMTTVYPTDFFGNDRPITTVTERCQSREFGRILSDTTEDPRSGTRSTTLQSITRGEPDASLFKPAADYVDAKPNMR